MEKYFIFMDDKTFNIVKMAKLPTSIYSFSAILIKILAAIFAEIDKQIQKFLWKCKGTQTGKMILKKKNKAGGVTFSNFKSCYKTIIIKTMWY